MEHQDSDEIFSDCEHECGYGECYNLQSHEFVNHDICDRIGFLSLSFVSVLSRFQSLMTISKILNKVHAWRFTRLVRRQRS